jgi:hypothetical protein
LENRVSSYLKGSEALSRGKTEAEKHLKYNLMLIIFHLRYAGKNLYDLSTLVGRMTQEAAKSLV